MLSDYALIWFKETKWHDYLITRMVKHRPLKYEKNVKKLLKYCVVK